MFVIRPTGHTRLAAVIGKPVRHSLSPAIHNRAFEAADLNWSYVAFEVETGQGAAAVEAMRVLGIGGLSVTMPHKFDVVKAVDEKTTTVEALDSCNCVFWRDGKLVGDSTDGDGFVRSLRLDDGIDIAGKRLAIVGTGGAARSLIEAAGRHGADDIVVLSRSKHSAEAAADLADCARAGTLSDVSSMDMVVNASPLGMAGGPGPAETPVPVDLLAEHHVVVDIVYNPRQTPLLVAARERSCKAVDGLGMLVHQAAIAFEHWTGVEAPLDVMRSTASTR